MEEVEKILTEIKDDFVKSFDNDPLINRVCCTIIAEFKERTKQLNLTIVSKPLSFGKSEKLKVKIKNKDFTPPIVDN